MQDTIAIVIGAGFGAWGMIFSLERLSPGGAYTLGFVIASGARLLDAVP